MITLVITRLTLLDSIRTEIANGNIQTASLLSAATQGHNSGLSASLDLLSQQTNTNIIPLDVNSLFNQAIAQPQSFGFTNVPDACLTSAGVCNNPNEHLFWNENYPTTVAHQFIGDLAFSAVESKAVPEPSANLGILAIGSLGAVALHKRVARVK